MIFLSLPNIKMKEDVYKDKDTLTKIIFLFNKSDNQLIQISSNHKQLTGTCLKKLALKRLNSFIPYSILK